MAQLSSSKTQHLSLDYAKKTGLIVTKNHFGGNQKYSQNTDLGVPSKLYSDTVDALGLTNVRIPAGEVGILFKDGLLTPGGELTTPVINLLEGAKNNKQPVVLVTPIRDAWESLGANDTERAKELAVFVKKVLKNYGNDILGFEIGNEFWSGMSEARYGEIANASILAIERAVKSFDGKYDPKILVQTANPSGSESMFDRHDHAGSWNQRIELANEAVLGKLSKVAKSSVDGIVAHYYFDANVDYFEMNKEQTSSIAKEIGVWLKELPSEPEIHITEWNVKASHTDQLGMKAAATMLEQFEYMLRMGVDSAYVWPPVGNTRNKLVRATDGEVKIDSETATVTNSVNAAIFSRMSNSLKGLQLMNTNLSDSGSKFEVNTYASKDKMVLYISSLSKKAEKLEFDIDINFGKEILKLNAIKIGYDPSTADGWFSTTGGADESSKTIGEYAEKVTIQGNPYYTNEHDVSAKVWSSNGKDFFKPSPDKSAFVANFKPFEVLEVTYTFGNKEVDQTEGGNENLRTREVFSGKLIVGDHRKDTLSGGEGNDTLVGKAGDDKITDLSGSNKVSGGRGNDSIEVGRGNDQVKGGDGNDYIRAISGNNNIQGGAGNDRIIGGSGKDYVEGGAGRDRITVGSNDDRVNAGSGNDRLVGAGGDDILNGGSGKDVLLGGNGNDILAGGAGTDNVRGGGGADVFVFRDGDLQDWDLLSGKKTENKAKLDKIGDFEVGVDKIQLNGFHNVDSMDDLGFWETQYNNKSFFVVQIKQTNERFMVDAGDDVSMAEFANASNFDFIL